MGREDELRKMAKRLEKMVTGKNLDGALDLLKELGRQQMTVELLQATKIGVMVNGMRKHCPDHGVTEQATVLIKDWKRLLDQQRPRKEIQKVKKHKETESGHVTGCRMEVDEPIELYKSLADSQQVEQRPLPDLKVLKLEPVPKKHVKDHKPERNASVSSPKPDVYTSAPKTQLKDPRLERRASASSSSTASPPAPWKTSSDVRDERRLSSGSSPAASPPGSRKNSTEGREDRRPSISSLSAASPTSSQVKFADNREDRKNSSKIKTESPTTPNSPTSPTLNCALNPLFFTGNSVRDKCVEMIAAALKCDDDYKQFGTNCERKASEIEESIYKEGKATDMKYRNRVRSRISNLKDPKNPNLRRNVLCGAISAERIAVMTSEEMASDELKELRSSLTLEAIREHQMAKTGGTHTDLFQCGKCKKKNCSYNQVQTRSADEPMTTFVFCHECGFRWKFC